MSDCTVPARDRMTKSTSPDMLEPRKSDFRWPGFEVGDRGSMSMQKLSPDQLRPR